jgi:predicted O-methyltransferase YrrM
MSRERWIAVDEYLSNKLLAVDEALDAALAASAAAGLPPISVTASQGRFLALLIQSLKARRVLEIGTLGGYSSIWMASALPPAGLLLTLEAEPSYAAVADQNIRRAGQGDKVQIFVGPALQTLPSLAAAEPFDFIFIDADKENYPGYLDWSLKLSRPGTVIIADNVVRDGAVIEPDHEDPRVQGVRRFLDAVAAEPRVKATALQTVGAKGYDGFAMLLVS